MKNPYVATRVIYQVEYFFLFLWLRFGRKAAMVETDFGGLVYSADGIETIAGHVLSSQLVVPSPLTASQKHQRHHHRGQDSDGGGGGASNRLQRSSGSIVKRLDAKKTMAEISIPVRSRRSIDL